MNGYCTPAEIAENVIEIGKKKSQLHLFPMILLGMLAGVYIGFGAELCTMVTHDLSKYLGVGFSKFLGGSAFTVGLMLVVIAGAELFTGNCLILSAVLHREVRLSGMLRNWFFVYIANFAGSILLVFIMLYSGLWKTGNFGVGRAALETAAAKANLPFLEALMRGIGCNWLVCLAVWMGIAGKDSVSKIFGIFFPIMAFVASGFEHSVANMYFIPMGLFLKGKASLMYAADLPQALGTLTWRSFLLGNLLPVTLGNIVGGAFFVGTVYYLVYIRKHDKESGIRKV